MRMTKAEAAAELGIELGASEDDIRAAYKVGNDGYDRHHVRHNNRFDCLTSEKGGAVASRQE